MAKFSYDQLQQIQKATSNNEDKRKVGYFNSLKNDGDEAIVRFVYSNPSQFDLAVVHNVKVGEYTRYVSCLRNGLDDIQKCPLCARDEKVQSRFFVKMLEYVYDETGKIVPKAVVWDRPASFADYMAGLIKEYPNFNDKIFKIKRRGAKGDKKTRYDVMLANPDVYKEAVYPKDFSAFDDFDLGHHSYYELDYNDMVTFVRTGEIPQKEKEQESLQQTAQGSNVTGGYGNGAMPPYNPQPQGQYQPNNYNMAENNPFPQGQPQGYPQQNPYQGFPQGQPQGNPQGNPYNPYSGQPQGNQYAQPSSQPPVQNAGYAQSSQQAQQPQDPAQPQKRRTYEYEM